jgi:hypothetical protein
LHPGLDLQVPQEAQQLQVLPLTLPLPVLPGLQRQGELLVQVQVHHLVLP